MQDGIFNGGKMTQRTGYISTKHIYLYDTYAGKAMKHVCSKTIMHVCKVTKAITERTQARKSTTTEYCYYFTGT